MIYEDEHGIRYKVRETLNSMMRSSGVPCYKIHYSSTGDRPWFPVIGEPLGTRWWRRAESAEKYLKEYAEKHNWVPVEEEQEKEARA